MLCLPACALCKSRSVFCAGLASGQALAGGYSAPLPAVREAPQLALPGAVLSTAQVLLWDDRSSEYVLRRTGEEVAGRRILEVERGQVVVEGDGERQVLALALPPELRWRRRPPQGEGVGSGGVPGGSPGGAVAAAPGGGCQEVRSCRLRRRLLCRQPSRWCLRRSPRRCRRRQCQWCPRRSYLPRRRPFRMQRRWRQRRRHRQGRSSLLRQQRQLWCRPRHLARRRRRCRHSPHR